MSVATQWGPIVSPRELAVALGELWLNPQAELSAAGFHDAVVDSREVQPGDLFIALKGERSDGHLFIPEALHRGASGVLCHTAPAEAPPGVTIFRVAEPLTALKMAAKRWRRAHSARVIGITGSVGKTTTREAVAQIMGRCAPTLETPRNFNSEIGLPISVLGLGPQHGWAVLEIGLYSRAEMLTLIEIALPEIAIVTNIGPTHLERFGTLEAIEEAKGLLPESLPAQGLAVLNADDPRTRRMRERTTARVLTFGLSEEADVRASEVVSHGIDGLSFVLQAEGERVRVRTALIGRHQVMTALAAAAAAIGTGMPVGEAGEALAALRPGRRLQPRRAFCDALILDDSYNAAPISVRAALDLLAEMPGRRIAVLGDMLELGSEEAAGHREVGAYSVGRCERLLAIGPRARQISEGAWAAGHGQIEWYETKEAATAALRRDLEADDVVLVKASHGLALETLVEALVQP